MDCICLHKEPCLSCVVDKIEGNLLGASQNGRWTEVTTGSTVDIFLLVLMDHGLYLFTFENRVPPMRYGRRQWCGIFHNH